MSGRAVAVAVAAAARLVAAPAAVAVAQTGAERVAALRDGTVRLSYAVAGRTCWSDGEDAR